MTQTTPYGSTPPLNFDLRGRPGFVERNIRSMAAKARWTAFLLVGVVASVGYWQRDTILIFANGPRPVTISDLLREDPRERMARPWVAVSGLKLGELATRTSRRSQSISAVLHVHEPDESDIPALVVLGDRSRPAAVTGWLTERVANFEGAIARVYGQRAAQSVKIEARWAEIYLLPGLAALGGLACLGVGGWQWARGRILLNPRKSPPLLALMRFGPLLENLPVINADLGTGAAQRIGGATLGTDHIALRNNGMFEVFRISQLVWVHGEVQQNYYNGIPTHKTYRVALADEHGHRVKAVMSKRNSEKILETISLRNPAVLNTYSEELEALWNSDPKMAALAIKNRDRLGV